PRAGVPGRARDRLRTGDRARVQRPPPVPRARAITMAASDAPNAAGAFVTVERDGAADAVAVEEPLEIRVDGAPLAVTMRTPGHDEELAAGFLHGEGLIDAPPTVGPATDLAANVVEVTGPLTRDPGLRRFYTTSSCGGSGKG